MDVIRMEVTKHRGERAKIYRANDGTTLEYAFKVAQSCMDTNNPYRIVVTVNDEPRREHGTHVSWAGLEMWKWERNSCEG